MKLKLFTLMYASVVAIGCVTTTAHAATICKPKKISVTDAKAQAAALKFSPFTAMYAGSYVGQIVAADWMFTSDSQVSESRGRKLIGQHFAAVALSSLYVLFDAGFPSICAPESEVPFSVQELTTSDLKSEDTKRAQQRFLVFHSINMVSLGIISFESKHPQKGAALATAFFAPIVVDAINREYFSKSAYSPWTLTGGLSESGDPTLTAWFEF